MDKPENIWKSIWHNRTSDSGLVLQFWTELNSAYSTPDRYYHTMEHIRQMLNSTAIYSSLLKDITSVQLSIFYHDIVYNSQRNDNEKRSAELAEKQLRQLNYPNNLIEKCGAYILSTKAHKAASVDTDLDYFLDFDLEKLGAPWAEYLEYTKQIRKEYKVYPNFLYRKGRKKILSHFLELDRIFKTTRFFEKYEQKARQNISQELELL